MSRFISSLRAEKCAGDGWRLLHPLVYQSDVAQTTIVVPEGFETDFASVPRLPLAYLLTAESAHQAAVVHDYLYGTQEVDRQTADAVFLEAMRASGEPAWRARLMYWGVRLGGGIAWNSHEAA